MTPMGLVEYRKRDFLRSGFWKFIRCGVFVCACVCVFFRLVLPYMCNVRLYWVSRHTWLAKSGCEYETN